MRLLNSTEIRILFKYMGNKNKCPFEQEGNYVYPIVAMHVANKEKSVGKKRVEKSIVDYVDSRINFNNTHTHTPKATIIKYNRNIHAHSNVCVVFSGAICGTWYVSIRCGAIW